MEGGNPETRAKDNSGSFGDGLVFPSPILALPYLLNIFAKTHTTAHRRGTEYIPWRAIHRQLCFWLISGQRLLAS